MLGRNVTLWVRRNNNNDSMFENRIMIERSSLGEFMRDQDSRATKYKSPWRKALVLPPGHVSLATGSAPSVPHSNQMKSAPLVQFNQSVTKSHRKFGEK